MKITASGKALGAIIEGIDLAQQLSESEFKQILRALGAHGVLCFPKQRLATEHFVRFGRMFGELEINVANQFRNGDDEALEVAMDTYTDATGDWVVPEVPR